MAPALAGCLLAALLPSASALQQTPAAGEEQPQQLLGTGRQLASVSVGAGQSVKLDELERLEGKDGKCLNFVHIPKTAGTSIEELSANVAARDSGFKAWGMHDSSLKCANPYQFKRGPGCKFPGLPANQWGNQQQRCSLWHTPPGWDEKLAESYSASGCTTFCVVRDPVQRMISEASFRLLNCNATHFEEYMEKAFKVQKERVTAQDCHLLPQSEYVYGGKILGKPGKYCQRVLKMESLSTDFAKLMEEFGIPAELKHSSTFKHNCEVQLSEATKDKIRKMYGDDFSNFGYVL